ncbi:MAG: hypothetical protein NVSMB27_24520 [Ktedonobacteraceae bacterium]
MAWHFHLQGQRYWRHNPWWEEVLLLYVGRVHDASPLLILSPPHPVMSGFQMALLDIFLYLVT